MEDEYEEFEISSPWSWKFFGVTVCNFTSNVLQSGAIFARGIGQALAMAHNNDLAKREFHEQASLEIETLTNPEE